MEPILSNDENKLHLMR